MKSFLCRVLARSVLLVTMAWCAYYQPMQASAPVGGWHRPPEARHRRKALLRRGSIFTYSARLGVRSGEFGPSQVELVTPAGKPAVRLVTTRLTVQLSPSRKVRPQYPWRSPCRPRTSQLDIRRERYERPARRSSPARAGAMTARSVPVVSEAVARHVSASTACRESLAIAPQG